MKIKVLVLTFAMISLMSIHALSQDYPIYVGQELTVGFEMGVDTDQKVRDWLTNQNGYMKMEYPTGQAWGAVFITVGTPTNPPRPFQNFSGYSTLSVEMKGENGGEIVDIGIKDNTDPDNGRETKQTVTLTGKWQVYEFSLNNFVTADLSHLYVPVEFVFGGRNERIVYFRNVQYLR